MYKVDLARPVCTHHGGEVIGACVARICIRELLLLAWLQRHRVDRPSEDVAGPIPESTIGDDHVFTAVRRDCTADDVLVLSSNRDRLAPLAVLVMLREHLVAEPRRIV